MCCRVTLSLIVKIVNVILILKRESACLRVLWWQRHPGMMLEICTLPAMDYLLALRMPWCHAEGPAGTCHSAGNECMTCLVQLLTLHIAL